MIDVTEINRLNGLLQKSREEIDASDQRIAELEAENKFLQDQVKDNGAALDVIRERGMLKFDNKRLRDALEGVCNSYEYYVLVGKNAKPKSEHDEYDEMMYPLWLAAKQALDPQPEKEGE